MVNRVNVYLIFILFTRNCRHFCSVDTLEVRRRRRLMHEALNYGLALQMNQANLSWQTVAHTRSKTSLKEWLYKESKTLYIGSCFNYTCCLFKALAIIMDHLWILAIPAIMRQLMWYDESFKRLGHSILERWSARKLVTHKRVKGAEATAKEKQFIFLWSLSMPATMAFTLGGVQMLSLKLFS